MPKLKTFYTHYRHKDGGVWQGLERYRAASAQIALEMAKQHWIEEFNFARRVLKIIGNGNTEITKYEFAIYDSSL